MAIIPLNQKFHTIENSVVTKERGSALVNSQKEIFTMQDIIDTTGVVASPSAIAVNVLDGTPITGTTLTISTSLLIPANTIVTNSILQLSWGIERVSGTSGTVGNQVYINTTNSLTGATLVAIGGNLVTGLTYVNCSRDIQKVGTTAKTSQAIQMVNDGTLSASINTFTLNNATDLYFIFACNGGASDVSVIRQIRITQYI
jgi:hypothetical protein